MKDSRSFDRVAELYDEYRPNYPEQLVVDILSTTALPEAAHILEIGSGTGKATQLFARRGYSILCIEPGERMLAVARQKLLAFPKVDFRATAFEDWQSEGRLYDLVISGQAFHWIAPEYRYEKTAQVLRNSGHLAIFWNWNQPNHDPLSHRLEGVYAANSPQLVSESSEGYEEIIQRWVGEIEASSIYEPAAVRRYPWEQEYTTREYLGLLNTHSDHLRLPDDERRRLFEAIGFVLEEAGGVIRKRYEAVVFVAKKRVLPPSPGTGEGSG